MSDLDIGLMILDYFMVAVQAKIPVTRARREVVLRAEKLTTVRAAKIGIVDEAYDSTVETMEGGVRLGEELAGMGSCIRGQGRHLILKHVMCLGWSTFGPI
ncbi:hypothetical protein MRB53_028771 [Persea americana]|uniref:Uncharacterized protein n=1 Tax=Persea americana TaxID=3435 RepID=A0ACC2KGV3_PERAE|nr:hypothetical protein MRB53_028771 [Persea americana]